MNSMAGNRLDHPRAFPLGPDHFPLFPGRDYRHALEGLAEDLRRGAGLACLVGPAGIGKSILLRSLRARLQRGCVGELAQPAAGNVLSRLGEALGAGSGAGEREVLTRLQELHAAGRADGLRILQIVDSAETLTREDTALLRRLFGRVGGQLLLVGQPPLLMLLEGESMPPPDHIYRLEPLSPDEVGGYLRHRLNEAGLDRGLFDSDAVMAVTGYSGGIPRLINLLCFTALADPALEAGVRVTAGRIHEAARRLGTLASYPFAPPPARIAQAPAPETVTVVGERRSVPEEASAPGYGRMVAVLTLGMTLGLAAARLSSGGFEQGALSHALETAAAGAANSVQRVETALSASASALAAWWLPPPSPAAPGPDNDAAALAAVPGPPPTPAPVPPEPKAASENKPVAATAAGDDGAAGRLSLAARRHLAGLYGERAEYEMRAGRWIDARISILRGLLLAPDDAGLRATERRLRTLLGQQAPDGVPPALSAPPRPSRDRSAKEEIAGLYLQQAELERENRQLQAAMVSINSGLEEDPDNGDLLEIRRLVLDELAVRR